MCKNTIAHSVSYHKTALIDLNTGHTQHKVNISAGAVTELQL